MSVLPATVTRNWTLKLAAIGLSVFLWAVVRAEPPDREVVTDVPILVQIGDLDWREAAPPEPATVQVSFVGPAGEIIRLDRQSAAVRIPLEAVSTGDTTVTLRRDWVVFDGAGSLVVDDVVPSTVTIHLERTVVRAIPVTVPTVGRPRTGFALAGPLSVSPTVVRVRGTEGELAQVDSIRAQPVDLTGLSASTRRVASLDTTGLEGLSFTADIEVTIPIEEALDRPLPPIDIEVEGSDATGLEITPTSLPLTVRGPDTRTARADLSQLRLIVSSESVRDVRPGESRRVPFRVDGIVDPFLQVIMATDSVTVRREPSTASAADSIDGGAVAQGGSW